MTFIQAAAPRQRPETPAEQATRVRREADIIAKAHADIDAGLGIEDDDLEAWFDRLDQDENAPPPAVANPTSHR
jgi:hypothetical protein